MVMVLCAEASENARRERGGERRRGEEGTRYRMLVLAAGVGAEHGSVWEARLWAE
jgi:hypothetical protein